MPYEYRSLYFDNPIISGRALDIFMPEERSHDIALFFVHGGGWKAGARGNYHPLMRAFNAEGYVCGATDYRLGKKILISDQILDMRTGYDLFVQQLEKLSLPPRVVVIGSSAGAHLGALLALARPGECGEAMQFGDCGLGDNWRQPAGAILQATPARFEPWEDIFPHIWVNMQEIVGTTYEQDPARFRAVAPIEYVRSDSCPLLFLESDNEYMFPGRYTEELVRRMTEAGARAEWRLYRNTEHGFFYDVTRRQQQEAFRDSLAFLNSLDS